MISTSKNNILPIAILPGLLTFIYLLASCGATNSDRTERHEFVFENQTNSVIPLEFEAYYKDFCDEGRATDSVAPKETKTVVVKFKGCTNGGGTQVYITGIGWTPGGTRIICTEEKKCVAQSAN